MTNDERLTKRFNGLMTKFARQHRQILKMAWKNPDTPHIQHFKKMMCGPGGFFSPSVAASSGIERRNHAKNP